MSVLGRQQTVATNTPDVGRTGGGEVGKFEKLVAKNV
jgi:hypothetical protein